MSVEGVYVMAQRFMLVDDIVHDVVKEREMGSVNSKDGKVTLF